MGQFSVHSNPDPATQERFPLFVDVQDDLLSYLATRVVIPLTPKDRHDYDAIHALAQERRLSVDFRLTFREGKPIEVERVSGDRDALVEELRRAGLRVLSDDDPLAVAHREIKRAREEADRRGRAPR